MLTVIGSVGYRNVEPVERFDLRHFELQTFVYNPSKTAPLDFSLICYFSSGKRWEKVKVPNTGSYVSVTAKAVGRTTKENRLASHPGHVLNSKILLHSRIFTGFDPVNFVKATKPLEWSRRISNTFEEDRLFRS